MALAERLGGMTLKELVERMDADEYALWMAEAIIRDEERRDAQLEAQAKAMIRG